jgi:hypothetical protein
VSPDSVDSGGYDSDDDGIHKGAVEGGEYKTTAGCGRWRQNLRMNE